MTVFEILMESAGRYTNANATRGEERGTWELVGAAWSEGLITSAEYHAIKDANAKLRGEEVVTRSVSKGVKENNG